MNEWTSPWKIKLGTHWKGVIWCTQLVKDYCHTSKIHIHRVPSSKFWYYLLGRLFSQVLQNKGLWGITSSPKDVSMASPGPFRLAVKINFLITCFLLLETVERIKCDLITATVCRPEHCPPKCAKGNLSSRKGLLLFPQTTCGGRSILCQPTWHGDGVRERGAFS